MIDLHMHSGFSLDGEHSPAGIVERCSDNGISVMALTDHNSTRGVEEASEMAMRLGMTCIPAIEVDCMYDGVNIHMLGYGIDPRHEGIMSLHDICREKEQLVSSKRIEAIRRLGFTISFDDFPGFEEKGVVAPEDIAEVLLAREDAEEHELLRPYLSGGSRSDNPYANFFWDLYDTGKPCFCDMGWMDVHEALTLIREAGGTPVIAHPGVTLGSLERIDEIMSLGIRGIECFSSYHDEKSARLWYAYAKANGHIVTAGSDYHGHFKPSVRLGGYPCHLTDAEIKEEIMPLLQQ